MKIRSVGFRSIVHGVEMWLVLSAFTVLVIQVYYFESWTRKINKDDVEKPRIKLGTWRSIPVVLYVLWRGIFDPAYQVFMDLSEKYGNFFIYDLIFKNSVYGVLSDIDVAKKIMSCSKWANRAPENHVLYDFSFGKPLGLFFGSGGYWRTARKVTMKILHQVDFFRQDKIERLVMLELNDIEQMFLSKMETMPNGGTIMRMHNTFQLQTLNIVHQLLLGVRFERGDPSGDAMLVGTNEANRAGRLCTSILEFLPALNKNPFFSLTPLTRISDFMYNNFKEHIDRKWRTGSYLINPTDYTDYFLLEIDRRSEEDVEYLTDENLMVCIRDMLFASIDSTNATTEHGILNLSQNPEILQKLQKEVDEVVGSRIPTYNDKAKMPYMEAFIWEALRYGSSAPLTLRGPCMQDEELCGETVPKGSAVIINNHAINHSKDLWPDPDVFRPERFLNDAGDTIININKLMVFGHGKRNCVGDFVAKITLFLFFVTLIQKFTFVISDKHPLPSTKGQIGLSTGPRPFYVKIRRRDVCE